MRESSRIMFVECLGCGRRLDRADYSVGQPPADSEDHVRRQQDTTRTFTCVQCPNCGYYSIYTPWPTKKETP
jgi:predicted RNA-binding Zn-ribbon protein involved in translation (DUF1610 family)